MFLEMFNRTKVCEKKKKNKKAAGTAEVNVWVAFFLNNNFYIA